MIADLRLNCASLEERLAMVESERAIAIESHRNEKEARIIAERMQASLKEDIDKAQQELKSTNTRIDSLNATYRNSQEYNTSLQQYNSRLQMDCETYKSKLERLEQEKSASLEELRSLRSLHNSMQKEISSFQDSRDEAIKQKDLLNSEVVVLRAELGQIKADRDRQLVELQHLRTESVKYKEFTGKSTAELEQLTMKSNALEDTCSTQREKIEELQDELNVANEKLKMADLTTLEMRTEYEGQKQLVIDLQNRLVGAELQIVEAEKLRKKLHNTILELKGNIRVFCRVRPLLPDESAGVESPVISYPSSTESLGRAIDLLQNGQKHQFTFDKIFAHNSSQQDVFI